MGAGDLNKGRLSSGLGGSLGRGGASPAARSQTAHRGHQMPRQAPRASPLARGQAARQPLPPLFATADSSSSRLYVNDVTPHTQTARAHPGRLSAKAPAIMSAASQARPYLDGPNRAHRRTKFKHASLGVAFGLGLANVVAATLGACPCHTRQHIASHTREHTHRALAARKRLQVGVVEARYHVRKQHLALQVVDETAPVAQKLPKRAKPRCRRLVVNTQRNAGFRRIMTAQVELGKRLAPAARHAPWRAIRSASSAASASLKSAPALVV